LLCFKDIAIGLIGALTHKIGRLHDCDGKHNNTCLLISHITKEDICKYGEHKNGILLISTLSSVGFGKVPSCIFNVYTV
jgi:hypothetical protein